MKKTSMRKTEYQLNNKGLTFVEILVAVTMLTIVSLVFLRCISQSSFYNRDAREKQSALNLAQSLMEGFKAYDMTSIEAQYTTGGNSDFKLYTLDSTATKSKDPATGEYCLGNVKLNGVNYDARVTVSPYVSANVSVVTKSGLVDNDVPNKYCDAIYCGDEIASEQYPIYQMVCQDILSNVASADMDPDERANLVAGNLKMNRLLFLDTTTRNIAVNMTDNKVEVTVSYNFQFTYEYDKPTGSTETYASEAKTYTGTTITAFDNTATGVTLENVYLYLYPAYKSDQGGQIKCSADELTISNNSGSDRKVYVVKQHNRALSSGELSICEASYRLKVIQSGAQPITLYHNLLTNLSGHGGAGWIRSGNITDKEGLLDNADSHKSSRTQEQLLYNVKINVYKTGSATLVYELSGTVNAR
ncbi:MAG: hypothetical protein ACI4TL_00835 [Candidatus Cryptobacteroides sp.]